MGDHIVEDGAFINSIVGEGTRFRGELDLNGLLRIDGDYSGVIRTPDKVLVGKNGRAECSIYAGTIVVGGVVKGNIYSSEKIIILTTGMVIGNVMTPRLIVEEGVILDGECRITKDVNIEELKRLDRESNDTNEEAAGPPVEVKQPVEPAYAAVNYHDNTEAAPFASGQNFSSGENTRRPEPDNQQKNDDEQKKKEGNTITVWNG